jgi:hypothetical protein
MPALIAACPSFEARWREMLDERPQADQGVYIGLGEFATHLVALLRPDETTEFPGVFAAVERLFRDGDDGMRVALKVGLIEGIGNVASNQQGWPFAARFRTWLGPAATTAWDDLHREWGTSDTG